MNDRTICCPKYYFQKDYIKLTKPLRPKMPSSLLGHGNITGKSEGYFYSKAIILIKYTLACVAMLIHTLPNKDGRPENLVNLWSAKQSALC